MTQAKPRETKTFASDAASLETRKERARVWFEALRDDMLAALEAVEDEAEGSLTLCRGACRALHPQGLDAGRA